MTCSSAADDSNMLPQPVNEQCWSNEAEEGEELLEVRSKGWGEEWRWPMYWNTHILIEMEKYSALKTCAHKCALKSGVGYWVHLVVDTFICVLMISCVVLFYPQLLIF